MSVILVYAICSFLVLRLQYHMLLLTDTADDEVKKSKTTVKMMRSKKNNDDPLSQGLNFKLCF
jgi:hypothetical protein